MPEHPAIVGADAPGFVGVAADGGKRPRRRFVTDPTDTRLFRVCRHPRPSLEDPDHCRRCGAGLDRTAASRTGFRHRPATRRPRPVVNVGPTPELTLSEVLSGARSDAGHAEARPPHGEARDITYRDAVTVSALVAAIAAHLSPRAGTSLRDWDAPTALEARGDFLRLALAAAARCPLCGPDLVDAGVCRRG